MAYRAEGVSAYHSHMGGSRRTMPLREGISVKPRSFYAPLGETAEPVEPDPLACPTCGRVCGSKIGLISHMRTHKV